MNRTRLLVAVVVLLVLGLAAYYYNSRLTPGGSGASEDASTSSVATAAERSAPAPSAPGELPPGVIVVEREVQPAVAAVRGLEGRRSEGTVRFVPVDAGGLHVGYQFDKLPQGRHALVLSEDAQCSSASTELGELVASVRGRARGRLVQPELELGGDDGILGRAVAVRQGDASGGVVACGVVEER